MTMRLVLKGREILARSGLDNAHQLSLRSQISSPTVLRLIYKSEDVTTINLEHLAALLVKGCGINPAEVAGIKLGELFDLVDN
jgi:hypothetical protein